MSLLLAQGLFKNAEKIAERDRIAPTAPVETFEGVSEVFESNPELTEIGTEEQYNAYLDTVFPDSKVKDIVYHGVIKGQKAFDSIMESGFIKNFPANGGKVEIR